MRGPVVNALTVLTDKKTGGEEESAGRKQCQEKTVPDEGSTE